MRNITLADNDTIFTQLLPLTFTRPISELLCGIRTIRRKWHRAIPGNYFYRTAPWLSELYPEAPATAGDDLTIASHLLPSPELIEAISALHPGQALILPDGSVAASCGPEPSGGYDNITTDLEPKAITRPYHIFMLNGAEITEEFPSAAAGKKSAISPTCTVIGDPGLVHIAPDARVEGAFLNTTGGPIYIGPGAEVMEGSCLRGPIAILEESTVNMGAKIYGSTTIGPHCKVGGELNNVVMLGYSNKAHDGFLGNAVIGRWCNLGAGCVASNLKNDYTEIKLWDYATRRFLRTGLQFCGLIMGDQSKAGINTMFNTATVIGVGVNVHGSGYPRNFVASFSEGSTAGFAEVAPQKFFSIAERVMARRGITMSDAERRMFEKIYELTETFR